MKVRIVDSFPPPVSVLVKTLPTFPTKAPVSHNLPVWSRKFRICPAMFPNLVGVPKMMASYCGSSSGVANGASCSSFYGSRAGGSQMGKCRDGFQQREHALDCNVPALALVLRD